MPEPKCCGDGCAPSSIEQVFDIQATLPPTSPSTEGTAQPVRSREQVLADLRRRIDDTGTAVGATGSSTGPAAWFEFPVASTADNHPRVAAPMVTAPMGSAARWTSEVLPVAGPLADLLPRGGLPRGRVISVVADGIDNVGGDCGGSDDTEIDAKLGAGGASSLLLSLLAGPERRWSALVGLPGIGLLAAAELGVDLERLVVVPDAGPDVLHVLSVLADGVDLIAVGAPGGPMVTPSRLRVLSGRLRQHGAVLLVAGQWPGADLVLNARHTGWVGIGRGHGRLRDRELTVSVGGRRAGAHRRQGTILLAGRRDGTVVPTAAAASGIPIEQAPASAAAG